MIGTMGFGVPNVSGRSRVPSPPTNTIACTKLLQWNDRKQEGTDLRFLCGVFPATLACETLCQHGNKLAITRNDLAMDNRTLVR
jgi:hypothetical protein